jgi:toxin-antitoxin system PIN domain toxin
MRALLDVNFLIALLDADHIHHSAAMGWLSRNIRHGWASCPLTQNGCVRILAQAAYPGGIAPAEAAALLHGAVSTTHHRFWPDAVSVLGDDVLDWQHLLSARQITDAYLLALAVKYEGRLVTFDRNVPLPAVRGVTAQNLVVI